MRFGDDWQARLTRMPGPEGVHRLSVTGTFHFDGPPRSLTVAPGRQGFNQYMLILRLTLGEGPAPSSDEPDVKVDWTTDVGIEYTEVSVGVVGSPVAGVTLPVITDETTFRPM